MAGQFASWITNRPGEIRSNGTHLYHSAGNEYSLSTILWRRSRSPSLFCSRFIARHLLSLARPVLACDSLFSLTAAVLCSRVLDFIRPLPSSRLDPMLIPAARINMPNHRQTERGGRAKAKSTSPDCRREPHSHRQRQSSSRLALTVDLLVRISFVCRWIAVVAFCTRPTKGGEMGFPPPCAYPRS